MKTKLTVDQFKAVALPYAGAEMLGGVLHIVADDGNLSDSDVDFCVQHGIAALALLMRQMTKTQRGRVSSRWYDWHDEARRDSPPDPT